MREDGVRLHLDVCGVCQVGLNSKVRDDEEDDNELQMDLALYVDDLPCHRHGNTFAGAISRLFVIASVRHLRSPSRPTPAVELAVIRAISNGDAADVVVRSSSCAACLQPQRNAQRQPICERTQPAAIANQLWKRRLPTSATIPASTTISIDAAVPTCGSTIQYLLGLER